ncbi:calcium homeostasis regulator [Perilla frutescens var. hirtella]|nr:calcium homeostasis regulator [Perilla frutescens var. hirtella]
MAVFSFSSIQTNPHSSHIYTTTTCKPTPPSLLRLCAPRRSRRKPNGGGYLLVRAYMEDSNSISGFASKVIGSLPVIGLVARIFSDEGGVGGDIIDFAEFRRRVGNKCSVNDSRAFFDFQERRGKVGEPLYVLLCCWLAAVGAGLLKSEEILEGVMRLRISDDIEFEEETFIAMMKESRERRAKLKSPAPNIPMAVRAEKALEAIYVCCYGRNVIEEEDEELLSTMLNAVFPNVGKQEIDRIVREKAKRVADGTDEIKIPEPKPLPKEAVKLQMKDLEFLQKGTDT